MQKERIPNWEPVYLITEAPDGWQKQSASKNASFLSKAETTSHWWEDITGVKVSESKFTVVIPVHNEEKSLSSSAGSLFLSLVPTEAGMETDFILNGCTDESEVIVTNLLKTRGEVVTHDITEEEFERLRDTGLQKTYIEVRQGNQVHRVYKTETKGKANALKLGSNLALSRNHQILISVDANNYVEPDTLALMFKEAYKHFVFQKDNTVVLSAIPEKVHKDTLGKLEHLLREHGVFDDATYVPVFGWCMALNSPWASKNIQPVAVEDYALGVMARSQDKKVAIVEDARIWGYRTNFKDSLNQFRRSIRGRLQLLDLHPELRPFLESDNYFMKPFKERIEIIAKHIKADPKRLPKYIWRFIYGEVGLMLGNSDYKKEPTNQSWAGLSSTK